MDESHADFRKVDLHIHTSASVCYSEPSATPEAIVEAALAAGLDGIAITDHNSAAGIDGVRAAADGRLAVFPGVEITTKNGHFLALFEMDTETACIEEFLDYAGIEKNGRGDAHTVAADETVETLKKIQEWGGIVIAAHIDRWPSGFMESKTTRRQKKTIHECRYLDALEITISADRQKWLEGTVRDFPLPRACIQGSDAHKPEEVGRRPVYIKLTTPNLPALRQAFLNYKDCIFFPNDVDNSTK